MKKKAIILGISGQDGSLLAKALIDNGLYDVYGTSRDITKNNFENLVKLKILNKVKLFSLDSSNFDQVFNFIKLILPDEVYNLTGQTSVGTSFKKPFETIISIGNVTCNLLEAIRLINGGIKYFNAASSECFGDTNLPATEETCFNPISPYGVSKTFAFNLTKNYRDTYNLFASSLILSNHESFFRSNEFISQKIIQSAYNIRSKKQDFLEVGDISVIRDWGWAQDYVQAFHLALQEDQPDDYIIATGKSISLENFIEYVFIKFNLNYKDYLVSNNNLKRKNEVKKTVLNVQKANTKLKWIAKNDVFKVIDLLIEHKIKNKNEYFP